MMSDVTVQKTSPDIARIEAAIGEVCDPEIPVLTLNDLGVVRAVEITHDGVVEISITPTYSGCPAMGVMALDLQTALMKAGFAHARIKTILSPAWTTDWMSAEGRAKLLAYGIAPPAAKASRRALFGDDDQLSCPRCASKNTTKMSEFGSTACKSLWRCTSCLEPFDAFKCI
jgi:ring-1,2-phenylacetyl-CoA epoxidase subunit PaaD